jgi:hypothetical protein
MVSIILKRPSDRIAPIACAGITIPWPVSSSCEILLMTTSALPSITWTKVSKGDVLFFNSWPRSNDTALILPVDFFIIYLSMTESGI